MRLVEDLAPLVRDPAHRRELGHVAAELDAQWALTKRNVTQSSRGHAGPRRVHDEARLLRDPPAARRAVAAGARARRARRRRQGRVRRGAAADARAHDRGGHVADPAQHPRRARARPARRSRSHDELRPLRRPGRAARRDPQPARGQVPDEPGARRLRPLDLRRPRARPACSRCGPTGSAGPTPRWSTRSSGGRCVPGPAGVDASAATRSPAGSTSPSTATRVRRAPRRARHAARARRRGDRDRSTRRPSRGRAARLAARPADAGARRSTTLPDGDARRRRRRAGRRCGPRARCSPRRSASGWPTRCTDLAVAYAKEREQFNRPIGSFQAVKHLCADMVVRAEVARGRGVRGGVRPRRPRDRRAGPGAQRGEAARQRGRDHRTGSPRRRCSAGWASPGRSTCTST